jgi:hypothetical protein
LSDHQARKVTRYATSLSAEAYFAETVILVEGPSDLLAVRVLAANLGIALDAAGVSVLSLEGGDLFPHYLKLLGRDGLQLDLRGLCDSDKTQAWITHLRRAGLGVTDNASMAAAGFHACVPDLEGELVAALGDDAVDAVLDADGALRDFQSFAAERADESRTRAEQQVAFIQKDKVRWAPLVADAVPPAAIPQPIRDLLVGL